MRKRHLVVCLWDAKLVFEAVCICVCSMWVQAHTRVVHVWKSDDNCWEQVLLHFGLQGWSSEAWLIQSSALICWVISLTQTITFSTDLYFLKGSHCVALAGLELTVLPRLASNLKQSSCQVLGSQVHAITSILAFFLFFWTIVWNSRAIPGEQVLTVENLGCIQKWKGMGQEGHQCSAELW